jgi:hypothetical protein
MMRGGVYLSGERLAWRVYIAGKDFYFYAYTIMGVKGEREAVDTVLEAMGMIGLRVKVIVATVKESDLIPPPLPSQIVV